MATFLLLCSFCITFSTNAHMRSYTQTHAQSRLHVFMEDFTPAACIFIKRDVCMHLDESQLSVESEYLQDYSNFL